MTMVCGDPAAFAVDWDWQRGLTVWELAGRRSEPRFDRKALEHERPARRAAGAGRSTPLVAGRWAVLRRSARRAGTSGCRVVIPGLRHPGKAPVMVDRR